MQQLDISNVVILNSDRVDWNEPVFSNYHCLKCVCTGVNVFKLKNNVLTNIYQIQLSDYMSYFPL